MAEQKWQMVIKPKNRLLQLDLKELWKARDLIRIFFKRNMVIQYKQTILGPIWYVLQPILTVAMNIFVFGYIARMSTDGLPKPLFYLAGNICWTFYALNMVQASTTFIDNKDIFGKVYFPRMVIPVANVMANLVKFLIQCALLGLVYVYYLLNGAQICPSVHVWMIPVFILMMAGLGLGFGLIITSLTTKYRDLSFFFSFMVNLWMYASPVFYPLSIAESPALKTALLCNPVTSIFEGFKAVLFGTGFFSWTAIAYSFAVMIAVLLIGLVLFNRIQRTFMDTV